VKTKNDFVTGVKLEVLQPEDILNRIINATINDAYEIIFYCGLETLVNAAKIYDFKTSGKLDVCKDFAIAKAQQKNVNKEWLTLKYHSSRMAIY
jgi:hypothetical protein